ncbi:MAG TPA: SulP family inorganic anion transporter [Gammaproteobacteria bacterium]
MALIHGLHFNNLRGDLFGGVTAAVVALPLALAFGVASGAGPVAGLYGAIFVGFFAALFGGTPAQVSGPTGPMTVVMAGIITQYSHEPAMAFTVVMLGGLFMIGFGLLRLGQYINLVPFPVVSGFMSGIGCIIILLELAPLLGHPTAPGGVVGALEALPGILGAVHWDTALLGAGALALLYLWPPALGRWLPAPLLALLLGTLAALWFLPEVAVIGAIPGGLPSPHLPTFELALLPKMLKSALVLALLGSIDSLLTSLVADNMTQSQHRSDRELIGQGLGNALAGLFGAIPGAGATMRTVINIRTGGQTPLSGATHAVVLLALVLGLGPLASHIPHAVLAGILLKVGIDIIDWDYLRRLRHAPREGVIIMFAVLLLTVLVDLITAVSIGVVVASMMFVKQMADLQTRSIADLAECPAAEMDPEECALLERHHDRIVLFHIAGPMSFGAVKEMTQRLTSRDRFEVMIIDLTDVPLIDSSVAMALEDVSRRLRKQGRRLLLCGLGPQPRRMLNHLGVLRSLERNARHRTRHDALRHAHLLLTAG